MSAQAEMILKKKREIEAKMASEVKKKEQAGQPRKPISMSINKRWWDLHLRIGEGCSFDLFPL